MTVNNNIKQDHYQALDRFFRLGFVMTPFSVNNALERENWQALKGYKEPGHYGQALYKTVIVESPQSHPRGREPNVRSFCRGKKLSSRQQEVRAQIQAKVGGEG